MTPEDWDYLDARLCRPVANVLEAYRRLHQIEKGHVADPLMEAMKKTAEACIDVREKLGPRPISRGQQTIIDSVGGL